MQRTFGRIKKRHTFVPVTYNNLFYLKKLIPIENLIKKELLRKSSFLLFIYTLNYNRLYKNNIYQEIFPCTHTILRKPLQENNET